MTRRKLFFRALPLLLVVALLGALNLYRDMQQWPHIPTRGVLFHPFGTPVDYQSCGFHTGEDWGGYQGAPIYAIEAGEVVYVGPLWLAGPGMGRGDHSIVLYHPHGDYYTTYSHNSVALVQPGERVARGQQIAEMGSEGYAGGPHLHLEKVTTPFTGNWQEPFVGCDGYVRPSARYSPI